MSNLSNEKKPILLVMAAGMGSRYGGIKQIDPITDNGCVLLDFGIYDALKANFGKIVFVIRRDIEKDFRERLFDRIARNADAEYVFQEKTGFIPSSYLTYAEGRTKPWGTIQCVLSASKLLDTKFATLNSDDFYGRSAYELITGHFSKSNENALVGYYLKNTLSDNGTVTRGVCKTDGDYLTALEETYKIIRRNSAVVDAVKESGENIELTGEETASMNFFGFNTDALGHMENYWSEFLSQHAADPKAECLLPNFVGKMLKDGTGRVKVLNTNESWFGMTYPSDKAKVHDEINKLISNGVYPKELWRK